MAAGIHVPSSTVLRTWATPLFGVLDCFPFAYTRFSASPSPESGFLLRADFTFSAPLPLSTESYISKWGGGGWPVFGTPICSPASRSFSVQPNSVRFPAALKQSHSRFEWEKRKSEKTFSTRLISSPIVPCCIDSPIFVKHALSSVVVRIRSWDFRCLISRDSTECWNDSPIFFAYNSKKMRVKFHLSLCPNQPRVLTKVQSSFRTTQSTLANVESHVSGFLFSRLIYGVSHKEKHLNRFRNQNETSSLQFSENKNCLKCCFSV